MHAFTIEATEYVPPTLRLAGSCGYAIAGERVTINIDAICNDRPIGDLSGTLAVELWALKHPYEGGDFSGIPLAATSIGEVLGQYRIPDCRYDLIFQAPPEGDWHLVLMLREWTAAGYLTRDHRRFELPYRVAPAVPQVRKEADNVISVAFERAKRQGGEGRRIEVEEIAPSRTGTEPKAAAPAKPADKPIAVEEAAPTRTGITEPKTAARAKAEDSSISVNDASHDEIASVKGISHKVAENIVASRPFTTLEDLLHVKGIGERLLDKIRRFVRI